MPEAFLALVLASTSPVPALIVHTPHATLRLEVARTEAERERGLMFRTSLPKHTGMLFTFEKDGPVAFWMKNTLVPLDMIFLGPDCRVRSVAANVPVVASGASDAAIPRRYGLAKYVIELPAGEAARDGILTGTRLRELANVDSKRCG